MAEETPGYDGITDEEQAALAELEEQLGGDDDEVFDPEKVHQAALQETEEQEKPNDEAKPDEQKPDQEAASAAADAVQDGAASADASQPDSNDGARAPAAAQTPYLVAEAPADADAKLADISTKKTDLAKRFDDGDVTTAEYQAELDKLNREERAIERQIDRAQLAAELEEQRVTNEREAVINNFLAGVDIPRDPKNLRFQVLDAAVRSVASDEANAELSAPQIMQKAYDLCVEQGVLQAKQAPAQKQQEQKPAPKKQVEAPPSLARMPAAEATDTGENRFAWLAAIRDPDKHEREFAKLSAADQEAYLAAGG